MPNKTTTTPNKTTTTTTTKYKYTPPEEWEWEFIPEPEEEEEEPSTEWTYYVDSWGEPYTTTPAQNAAAIKRMQAWLDENEPDHLELYCAMADRNNREGIRDERGRSLEHLPDKERAVIEDLFNRAWEHALDTWPVRRPRSR